MSENFERDARPPGRRFPDIERRAAANDALDVEPLMTVCPNCATRFRVTEAQLQAARGRVRCGSCGTVFDGVDQLVLDAPREFTSTHDAAQALDELMAELMADRRVMPPPQAAEPLGDGRGGHPFDAGANVDSCGAHLEVAAPAAIAASGALAETRGALQSDIPENAQVSDELADVPCETRPGAATGQPVVAADALRMDVEPARFATAAATTGPSTASTDGPVVFERPRNSVVLWLAVLVAVALAASAALVLWLRFDTLVRDPAWRSTWERICPIVGCEIPVQRALTLVRPRNLTVQSAGAGSDQLVVRVLLVNDAAFAQPFPVLQLSFSDLAGAPLAGHRFQPREYLNGDASGLALMPVRTPVQIELRIPDPGANAVNYQLDLL
jgi:predicted Zn finger-like uncharacterized protein